MVVLIGLPGSGKSTIGRQLARRLSVPFIDSDQVIEHRLGCSIRDFFEREGEEPFRDVEQVVLDDLTQSFAGVLATGGGAVLRPSNRLHLRERGRVFYLCARPEDIVRRLQGDRKRPLLQVADPLQKLRDLYVVRDPLYRETAHFNIDIGRSSSAKLMSKILIQLEIFDGVPQHVVARVEPFRSSEG